jgi:hypothetical protein
VLRFGLAADSGRDRFLGVDVTLGCSLRRGVNGVGCLQCLDLLCKLGGVGLGFVVVPLTGQTEFELIA